MACDLTASENGILLSLKPHSWTYNFAEVSGNNLESSQTWGFCIQCLHYKPVSNHFAQAGAGSKSVSRGDCEQQGEKLFETFVPITPKNLASGLWSSEALRLFFFIFPSSFRTPWRGHFRGQRSWPRGRTNCACFQLVRVGALGGVRGRGWDFLLHVKLIKFPHT